MQKIPKEIEVMAAALKKAGFDAYLVGGCVRDILIGREPKDWDVATNAKPEEIQATFPNSVYENQFGTVAVKAESLGIIEVTTYRKEGRYTDKRHPDEIKFAGTIEEDLSRRDFTINAIAFGLRASVAQDIVDPFGGRDDLGRKIIRAVGKPDERFNEDALRLMRAVRLAAELGFKIEKATAAAIKKHSGLLEMIARERLRDELEKLIMTAGAAEGINLLQTIGLLRHIMPELLEGVGVGQNKHHIYTVFEHNLRALDYAARKNYSLVVRLASLLHDVGKPRTKRGEGPDSTFYNHDLVGAKMTVKLLDRLHFPKRVVEQVTHLVRYHLFYYNVGEVTEAGVRRFIRRVGPENIDDLIKVREADRIGSGVPKAVPYRLRHLLFMIEKVKRDPVSPTMLKVRGDDVMKIGRLTPGPKIGHILAVLLEEVLDDPRNNNAVYLKKRTREFCQLPDAELLAMADKAKKKKEEFEGGLEAEMKSKYYVK